MLTTSLCWMVDVSGPQNDSARSGACGPEGDPVCGGDHPLGGQAVLEGVMMRGRRSWGLAVRRPDGQITLCSYPLSSLSERYSVLRVPVVRGVLALGQSLSLGVRALGISADLSLDEVEAGEGDVSAAETEEPSAQGSRGEFGWKELTLTVGVAAVMALVLFVVIPLGVAKYFEDYLQNALLFNLAEGMVRIIIFILYVVGISLLPDLRRVFEYHGAEHKVIHAYEAGEELDPNTVNRFSPLHPRCGTAFLLVVMVLAIVVFSLVGKPSLFLLVVSRVLGIPLIAGLSYEMIRYAGRHKEGLVARVLVWPGLVLQRLTTREPDAEQLEVAAAALVEVLRVEQGGEVRPFR